MSEQTTVNVPLERFKELERIEQAYINGEPTAILSEVYDYEICDFKQNKFYFNEGDNWFIKHGVEQWVKDLISDEIKKRYKEDKPNLLQQTYNKIVNKL